MRIIGRNVSWIRGNIKHTGEIIDLYQLKSENISKEKESVFLVKTKDG